MLRFPTFLFTIALVVERKQISPEARKPTRASERLKITLKKWLRFPIFLFTIALVIERKQLSQQSTLTVVGTGPTDEETYIWVFDVILRLSEALFCFRASRANFLRSITRAVGNKKKGKRKLDLLTSFWNFQKLSFVFAPPGITFCALSPGL